MAIDSNTNRRNGHESAVRRTQLHEHRTLVFIHGFLDSRATWAPLITALPPGTTYSIAIDLRGAGERRADAGPYTLDQAVGDVLELFEERDLSGVMLVGHSMGAQIAELVACEAPERVSALALITPTPLGGNTLPDDIRSLLRESGGDPLAQRNIRKMFSRNLGDHQLDRLMSADLLMPKKVVRDYYDAFTCGDARGHMPCPYDGPTLVLGATEDPVIPAQQVADICRHRFPAADFRLIDGSGHWPQLEQPGRTAEALVGHLGLS
jgi:pimeloyl-ACP methyl ester carboxylesterase